MLPLLYGFWPFRAASLCLSLLIWVHFSNLAVAEQVAEQPAFETWLAAVKQEARGRGITDATLESAFSGITLNPKIIQKDRGQPEFTQTFWGYLDRAVPQIRVDRARRLMAKHGALLQKVEKAYGVQPRFLVSFWGLESNFGEFTGGDSVIRSLVTLAYDTRRSDFFRTQLMAALQILQEGHIGPKAMTGSWAGAMGQLQFIPTTFTGFAVDFNGDGRRDIWHDLPDVFASAANYLKSEGWQGDQTWGREVRLPANFNYDLSGKNILKPLSEWQKIGVRKIGGQDLPAVDIEGAVIVPAGARGPAFMVYGNFHATLAWNNSLLYAIAVGHLADRIAGKGPLQTPRPARETPMPTRDIAELQDLLGQLGYDVGTADGIAGSQTRAALKAFQRSQSLPTDGFPTPELLRRLRRAQGQGQGG